LTGETGTSRSAVSRRFVAASEGQMAEWLGRDLCAIDLIVLILAVTRRRSRKRSATCSGAQTPGGRS
jgi:hypothetical protein